MPAKFGSLWQVIGMADAWVLSLFPSPEAFWAFCCSLWLLLLAFACFSMMPRAKPQEGRTRRRRYRRNQENCRVWDVHDSSQPSRKPCPKHPELDGVPRLAQLFNTILEDLNRYIEMYNFEITEGTDDSLSPISTTETSSSSGMSLSSGRKNSCTSVVKMGAPCSSKASLSSCSNVSLTSVLDMEPCCSSRDSLSAWSDNSLAAIVATKDSGSSEAPLTPCKDDSHTYTRVSEGASQLSLTALLDGADMVQASTVQPCLLPSTVPEEQHDMGTHPSCTKEVASCHRADRVQQQQKQLRDQQGAPTPPPLVPDSQSRETEVQQKHLQDQQGAPTPPPLVSDSQSRETEVPLPHQETQETVHCLAPRRKEEVKLELPTDGVGPQQHSPASVPQTPQRPPKPNVIVIPMVKDIPFLDVAVKRQLERHIVKRQIERRFGLPAKVLAYEKDFLEPILEQQESQPLSLQRCIGQPYHSPFQKRDRCTTKSAVCPPGLQQESAARKNTCTRGTQTPAQSVPAAIPRVAQGMPQKDGKRPHWKRESGGTARSSSMTSKKTLPCTKKKDQGSGTQSDGQGTSPSIQEEQAPPLSKGAPQGQSEQDCVSPTISTETQELQLEKNVPTGEAEHSQEGQSGIGGDVGTPELPSNRTSPSRSSPPQTQHCSDGTPSALPMPQDSAGTSILTPYLEELLMTLMDCYTARTAAENLQNQLLALWLEKNSSTDQAAKHPVASPRRRPKESQKGKRHTQGGAGSRRPCPKCSSSLHHNLPGSVGSQPSAPSEAATPGAGRNRTAGERHPPKERAKRKQGQKVTAADTQQPEGIRVYRKLILIPPVEEERLPSQRAPAWTLPSGTRQLPRRAAARHRNHRAETPPLPGSLCCVLTPILLCLQCAWDTLRDAGKALLARIKK